jgi:MFS family permease
MALSRDLYPPSRTEDMIRMQTVMATMMVLGLVGGPIVGGLLADHAGWRWAFWLNLPIGLAATAILTLAPPPRRPAAAPSGRLDVAGILLLAAGLSLALTGLSLKGNAAGGHTPGLTPASRAACSAASPCSPCSSLSSGAQPSPSCRSACSATAPTPPC